MDSYFESSVKLLEVTAFELHRIKTKTSKRTLGRGIRLKTSTRNIQGDDDDGTGGTIEIG